MFADNEQSIKHGSYCTVQFVLHMYCTVQYLKATSLGAGRENAASEVRSSRVLVASQANKWWRHQARVHSSLSTSECRRHGKGSNTGRCLDTDCSPPVKMDFSEVRDPPWISYQSAPVVVMLRTAVHSRTIPLFFCNPSQLPANKKILSVLCLLCYSKVNFCR